MTRVTYRIDKIDTRSPINLKGWKIVQVINGEDDGVLMPFTTKAEALRLLDFFGAIPASVDDEELDKYEKKLIAEFGDEESEI